MLAEQEQRPGVVERAGAVGVQRERLGEEWLGILGEQRAAACAKSECPPGRAGLRKALERGEGLARPVDAPTQDERLDEVGGRQQREVGVADAGRGIAHDLQVGGRLLVPAPAEVEQP